MGVDWSDIPKDVLVSIAKRTDHLSDYIRFGAVCKSWRSAITGNPDPSILASLCSYCLVDPSATGDAATPSTARSSASCTPSNSPVDHVHIDASGSSSDGWVCMVDSIPHLYLLNPFSRAVVHLPHLWANCSPVFDEYLFKVVWSAKPTDPNFIIVFLKRDAYSAVYCRTGDARWKLIHGSLGLSDAIFYKEKLYVVDDEEGCVAAVDLLHRHVVEEIRMPELVAFSRGSHLERMYLAAGSSGLLFIVRQMKRSRYCSQGRNVILQTGGFKVFKLDETTTKWNETKSLGDGMLFLGRNESMWLPSSNFKECKGNCIYFTDDSSYNIRHPILQEDSGIFHLEDGRFSSIYGDGTKRLYPNPVWVVPNP